MDAGQRNRITGLGYRLTVFLDGERLIVEGSHWLYFFVVAAFVLTISFFLLFSGPFKKDALIPLAIVWLIGLTLFYLLPPIYRVEAELDHQATGRPEETELTPGLRFGILGSVIIMKEGKKLYGA